MISGAAIKKPPLLGAAKIVVRFLYIQVFSRIWNNFFSQDTWIFLLAFQEFRMGFLDVGLAFGFQGFRIGLTNFGF